MSTNSSDESDADWITPAEAARLHGVTRQAISKLIRAGRLKTREVGGRVFVSRDEIRGYHRKPAGRPKGRPNVEIDRFIEEFEKIRSGAKREILRRLRDKYPIHPLESTIGATAEVILEAIERSGPLMMRGLRGVLAESAFDVNVATRLSGWQRLPTPNDPPYDFLLDDGNGPVKVQVKLQRSKVGRPMLASEGYRSLSSEMYLAETQRTRGGKNKANEDTRPYRFGEFDILAVAMQPSARDWRHFRYTVSNWLIPQPGDGRLMLKYQPVSRETNDDWTDDFLTCVNWLRSEKKKTIRGSIDRPIGSEIEADI